MEPGSTNATGGVVPNVLYVVLEDFSTLASTVFSPEPAASARRTPHLDRLAARSVVFRNTFCQAPICNPSRTSFLTGRRPTATQVWSNDDSKFPPLPTIVDFVRSTAPSAAVACTGRGKIFHRACDVEPHGFENGETQLTADAAMASAAERTLRAAIRQSSIDDMARRSLRNALNNTPRYRRTKDQEKTAVALLLLGHYAATRTRFFLAVGLASTHVHGGRICIPGAYENEGGKPIGPDARIAPSRAKEIDPPLVTWPNWDIPRFDVGERWQREVTGHYFACATHVDSQIGLLTDALDVLKLTASTAIVVQGDHGFSLGRHGRWSKYNLYEDATRVPLLMAVPGRPAAVVTTVVESLDVTPTLLDLWGVRRKTQVSK